MTFASYYAKSSALLIDKLKSLWNKKKYEKMWNRKNSALVNDVKQFGALIWILSNISIRYWRCAST